MSFSLPPTASVPPIPGEHGYYHSYHSATTYRTEDDRLVNFSLKDKLKDDVAWVTYYGSVPEKMNPVQRDAAKSWYYH